MCHYWTFVDLAVIYNTGGLEKTGPTMWIAAEARCPWRTNSYGWTCQMIDAEGLKACPCFCAFRSVWSSGGSDTMFFSPSTWALAEIMSFEMNNHWPRTAGCDITGRTTVTMTSSPKRPIQVSIIEISLRLRSSNNVIHLFVVLIRAEGSWSKSRGLNTYGTLNYCDL